MRKLVVASLLVAPLLLAGCGSQTPAGGSSAAPSAPAAMTSAATPAPAATAVTGTVALEQNTNVKVTPQAKLELTLLDVTQQPSAVVNKQDFDSPTFPQAFHIPFSASAIDANDLYVLQATMQDGNRTWTTKIQQPVLTRGQPAHVSLTLAPEPTRAEKMLAAFNQAKAQTGGMKHTQGSSSKIGEARSWQVFRDLHGVEFVIEQVNNNDKEFTKTQYAYRNGLPWVVVQQKMSSPNGTPTSTTRVGWGSNEGKLVLNQLEQDGKTTTVSTAQAKKLHDEATAEYKKFSRQH